MTIFEQALRAAREKPPREALLEVEKVLFTVVDGQWVYRELAEVIRRARMDYEKDYTLRDLFREIEGPPLG